MNKLLDWLVMTRFALWITRLLGPVQRRQTRLVWIQLGFSADEVDDAMGYRASAVPR